jgi:osmotically-inducible protein OsmY
MRTDADIEHDAQAELRFSPDIDATDIAVKATGGIVTLTGFVANHAEKHRAERAVKRIAGVAAVANDIEVRAPSDEAPTDPQIAREAIDALKREMPSSWHHITPLVHERCLTLEGAVEWNFQRQHAEEAVRRLNGVMRIHNLIEVKPRVEAVDVQERIEDAFRRNAAIDADHIMVESCGDEVTLRGKVRSWAERELAEQTAWSAPGVAQVHNNLTVRT